MSSAADNPWGRVDDEGNVYVRTSDGERVIGQWIGGDPEEAMSLYVRRFEGLEVEVSLLEKRLETGTLSPDDAIKAADKVRSLVTDAQAVGDLETLAKRLDALQPAIEKQRAERKAARAAKAEEAVTEKSRIADLAEALAKSDDWRAGADRLRELLDEWKALPRIDKKTDDALWHRFSSARTTYTRRRKTHFGEQATLRDAAQAAKEELIKEAEALSTSTDWGVTAGKYRDLMARWKKAGSAPRGADDKLWKKFRAAQDTFFEARDATNAQLDAEYEVNAEKKLVILEEAEKLLPIKNVEVARKAWHDISDRWEAAGKVPRDKVKEFEGRIRKVEAAIRSAGDDLWKRSNPELTARADETVSKLQKAIDDLNADLKKAEDAGNAKKAKEIGESIAARQLWLEQAQKALADFS
ncbi:MAG: DUF349 domain-containing protein [Aeromicrobium sp.]